MKQLYTILTLLLGMYISHAQVVLQDFSNLSNNANADVFGGFGAGLGGTNALVDDPDNASNKVRQITTAAEGVSWKGVFVRPQTHYIDLTTTKTVSVKVYSNTATYFKGKIQAGQTSQADIELTTSESHAGSGWETLTFTFSTATGEWGELVLYTSVDASGAFVDPPTEVLTAYIDDLTAAQGSEIPVPATPSDSPADPTRDAADVISVFSDAYTDIVTDYNPDWGQAGSVSTNYQVGGNGNNLMVYSNFNYQGINVSLTDVSNMTHLHIDIWVAADETRTIKVSPILSAGSPIESQVIVTTTPGSWNSVDIPLTSFTGLDFSNTIKEMKFDGQYAADGVTADIVIRSDIYLDNIYFYNDGSTNTGGGDSGGGDTGGGDVIFDFEDASQINSFTKIADAATRTDEVVSEHVTTGGNPNGAYKFGGTNADGAGGRNYSFVYEDAAFDYSTAATARITFDLLQASTGLPGTAIHFRYETPGGGSQFVGAIQSNGLNGSTWTSYQYDATVSGSSTGIFKITYEFAAGATQGDGGEVLLDNVAVTLLDSSGNVLSIQDLSDNSFMIYPNPVQNTLNVSAGATVDSVSIFDITGREVLRATPNAAAFSLDVANLNKGLYLVSLKAGDQEMTTKLVK